MPMQCIKTGCDAYLMNRGEFIHGDAFQLSGGDLLIRSSGRARKPFGGRRHFTIMEDDRIFDAQPLETYERVETIIVSSGLYSDHGYEGIPEPELAAT